MTKKLLKPLLIALLVAGTAFVCGSILVVNTVHPNDQLRPVLNEKIDEFHYLLVQKKFEQIFEKADTDLKNKYTKQVFIERLKNASEKLGENPPKANVDCQESLMSMIRRKSGAKTYQLTILEISGVPNYRREKFY